jgi:thioredoxin-like negative regulator of GroEL|tara:strand:+ start:2237 stop:2647 length:411 start_codon:yes stop_codon:yes gene_type:complete
MRFIIILLVSFYSYSQSDVPAEYWIDDSNFEDKINQKSAFGDDELQPVVVEFWAEFNEQNCFAEWDKIENALYYRVDISKAPNAKKKYKVRMAPTVIVFYDGIKESAFKAGLDLLLPADLADIQEAVDDAAQAGQF